MRILLVVTALLLINLVSGDESVENETKDTTSKDVEESSMKTKRGIHGYASDIGYPIYGHGFTRYTPYARFPTVYKSPAATYALTPGNAIVHSFNAYYPKVFLPKPVLRPAVPPPVLYHPKPILPLPSVPIYANRYPVFVHKPVIVQKPIIPTVPQFSTSAFNFLPTIPQHIHPNVLPQPTLISQDGWRPIFSTLPNVHPPHTNQPAVTVLPPLNPPQTPSQTQTQSNFYLPPSPSVQHDNTGFTQATEQYHHQQSQNDLQAHLQQLQQIQEIQEIQHHQNFLRNEQNEGLVTSLSEQGYEPASNNGRYSGPSSYDVHLNSRGRLN